MGDGEILSRIERIDEQMHSLKKTVLESGGAMKKGEAKNAAKAWLREAKKLEKAWPKKAPTALEMTARDRRHSRGTTLH